MTDREKAIVMAYTGCTMLAGDKLGIYYKYVQEKLGRSVMTHELAFPDVQDAIRDVAKNDFIELAKDNNVPGNGWISVKDRLPESGQHVLATCWMHSLYGYKKQYVCEAYYAKELSISEGRFPEDTDCYDYSEEDDEYYLKEGWYEVIHNWDEYGSVVIGDFVTHWMPLPEPPVDI